MENDGSVTVSEVLHLALPPNSHVLGGQAGLCRIVRGLAIQRSTFPLFGSMKPGFAVLAQPSKAQLVDSNLTPAYLLREMGRMRMAVLIIDEPAAEEDIQTAEELGIPLILVPPIDDTALLQRAILRSIHDHDAQLVIRERELRTHLEQLLSQGSIQPVLDELSSLIGNAVHLIDENGLTVGQDSNHKNEPLSENSARFAVRVGGRHLGMLHINISRAECTPVQMMYGREGANVCAIELIQTVARRETEDRIGADLVASVLSGEIDTDTVYARLSRLGYVPDAASMQIVVAIDEHKGKGQARRVANDLAWAAQSRNRLAVALKHGNLTLVLSEWPTQVSEIAIKSWLAQINDSAENCAIGVSRKTRDMNELEHAIVQAIEACEMGQRVQGIPSPYHYEDLGLYRLLTGLRDRKELRMFYQETLGALLAYDQEHHGDLLRTLEVYFDQGMNASSTARALYVHRNTLTYRLRRIEEITEVSLQDAQARLTLQVALKVHQLILE